MNGWDLFTWVSSVGLAATAVVIFALFLRDARSVLEQQHHADDDE